MSCFEKVSFGFERNKIIFEKKSFTYARNEFKN